MHPQQRTAEIPSTRINRIVMFVLFGLLVTARLAMGSRTVARPVRCRRLPESERLRIDPLTRPGIYF